MTKMLVQRAKQSTSSFAVNRRLIVCAGVALCFVAPIKAIAQSSVSSAIVTSDACQTQILNNDLKPTLIAVCGKRAITLGHVDNFDVQRHGPSGAIVVTIETTGERRVLLVRPDGPKGALLEDLTGDIAKAAGRASDLGLEGLEVDLAGLTPLQATTPLLKSVGSIKGKAIYSIEAHLARDDARRKLIGQAPHAPLNEAAKDHAVEDGGAN